MCLENVVVVEEVVDVLVVEVDVELVDVVDVEDVNRVLVVLGSISSGIAKCASSRSLSSL